MAFKHKPGQGTLFQNEKVPGSKQPILKGVVVTPDGNELEIACWTVTDETGTARKDKNGRPFYSVKLSEPRSAPSKREEPRGGGRVELSDEFPFSPDV